MGSQVPRLENTLWEALISGYNGLAMTLTNKWYLASNFKKALIEIDGSMTTN
jgi:hypothetical protein